VKKTLIKTNLCAPSLRSLLSISKKSENGKNNNDAIPDGFYLVGDTENPRPEWSKAIIDKVRTVTHICAADSDGNIVGEPMT